MNQTSLIALLYLAIQSITLHAQNDFKIKDIGTHHVQSFTPNEYLGHSQVWNITQDDLGVIYAATTSGISQFDGKYWRSIDSGTALSITLGTDKRIYVGGYRDISVLIKDSTNTLIKQSLRSKIPLEYQKTKSIYYLQTYRNDILFMSSEALYVYHIETDTFNVLPAKKSFRCMSKVEGRLLVIDSGIGLLEYKNGKLLPIENGEKIKDLKTYNIVQGKDDELLFATQNNGLFKFSNNSLNFWDTEISNYLKNLKIYSMIRLKGNYLAISTNGYGVFIIDEQGVLIQKINKKNALNSNTAYGMYQDNTGMLWIGTKAGISLVHIQSPFTFIGEKSGLLTSYTYSTIHNNILYICGDDGIYKKDLSEPWQTKNKDDIFYHYDQKQNSNFWFFIEKEGDLFCGGNDGLYLIKKDRLELIAEISGLSAVSLKNSPSFLVNAKEKLELIRKEKGIWKHKWSIEADPQEFDFMYEMDNGDILGSESTDGLFRMRLNKKQDGLDFIRHYTLQDGLPTIRSNRLYKHQNKVAITTRKGVFKLDLENDRLVPDKVYNELDSIVIFRLPQDPFGNILLTTAFGEIHYLKNGKNENFEWFSEPFMGLERSTPEFIMPVNEENVYMLPEKGLLHYDPSITVKYNDAYSTLIRRVNTTTHGDSIIFGGVSDSSLFILPYTENALSFEYSATYYDRGEALLFQYNLNGFDNEWSEWTISTEKEYTNLPHGDFEFNIRSKNIYGYEGNPAIFKFSILPPWYFTSYAYFGYAALSFLLFWFVVKLNTRRLIKEKKALEQIVLERTEEIREQRNSIEKQAKKLQEMDEVKSRFFANISHELRTPITLINGPIDAALNGEHGVVNIGLGNLLNVARKNCKNLLMLVNEILDLTKLEAGKLKLIENPVHLHTFLIELLEAYEAEIDSRKISFQLNYQYDKEVSILLDEAKFGKIINNLLSNAFKFTPDNGVIQLGVNSIDEKLAISIKDNGQGIHPDDLNNVFDRFYQSEQPGTKAQGGTGIGLALSQELAKLHEGTLSADSELGIGSEFTFSFSPNVINNETIEMVNEEINIGLIKTNLNSTISKYIDVFHIKKPVLLLIEDHAEMREFIAQIIRPFFVTLEAMNGLEGLEMLKNNQVDMIISDVMMPKMDGFELLENIKGNEKLKDISMIMLTARAAEEDKLFALTLGVDDYLTKPFNHVELLIRTKNILENRAVRKLAENEESLELEHLPNVDEAFIDTLKTIVEKNINDSLLSVSFLADQVAMTRRQLLRKLKTLTGYSPGQFIKEIRLQKAKSMLENNQVSSVAEASYNVGINKVKYFSNQYTTRFGKRPSDSLAA